MIDRMRRFFVVAAIQFVILSLLFEGASIIFVKLGLLSRDDFLYEKIVLVGKEKWQQYFAEIDAELGTPLKTLRVEDYDVNGQRPSSFNDQFVREGKGACVSAFGDSFAYSADVGNDDAWTNVLAGELKCPVLNFGVGGYGTDQAFLRYRQKAGPFKTPITLLTYIDMDIRRNLEQNRSLNSHFSLLSNKPKFILKGEELVLLPIAAIEARMAGPDREIDLATLYSYDHRFLSKNSPYSLLPLDFPYMPKMITALYRRFENKYYESRYARGRIYQLGEKYGMAPLLYSKHSNFSHWLKSSEDLQTAILKQFIRECTDRGGNCLILRIPSSLNEVADPAFSYAEEGVTSVHILNEPQIAAHSLPVAFTNDCMRSEMGRMNISLSEIPKQMSSTGGHYNQAAYKALGLCVAQFLVKQFGQDLAAR